MAYLQGKHLRWSDREREDELVEREMENAIIEILLFGKMRKRGSHIGLVHGEMGGRDGILNVQLCL